MTEPAKNKPLLVVQLTEDQLFTIMQDAVKSALRSAPRDDKLLTVEEVCQILHVNPEWLYHNAKKLPFARKIGGMLRFSSNGLQRFIETARFTSVKEKG